jgi:competence protein ComGF
MAKKKMTRIEREEWEAFLVQMQVNADRTRELAEKAQAKLDAQAGRR